MATDSDNLLRVQVWGMFLETLTFGMYLVTCGSCYPLFFTTPSPQRRCNEINWMLLIIFLLFLAKATSSTALHLDLILSIIGPAQDDFARVFLDASDPINLSKYATILIESVIGSGFLLYRCWLVHHRAWLTVAIPLVLWFGGIVFMGIFIHVQTAKKIKGLFSVSQSRTFGACFWAFILAANLITTGMIAVRVCRINRLQRRSVAQNDTDLFKKPAVPAISGQRSSIMKRATRIIIESGMIYTTMTLVTFLLFVSNSNAVYASIDVLVQAIAITFNLIVIQNRPRGPDPTSSYESRMNSVPLQFVSSNTLSVPGTVGSAIEFAYPKHFNPRRKNRPVSEPAPAEVSTPSIAELPQTYSQQSV